MSMLLLIFLNSYYFGTFSNAIENSAYSYACLSLNPHQSPNPQKLPILNVERFPYIAATS
jgi:hypothetical protein